MLHAVRPVGGETYSELPRPFPKRHIAEARKWTRSAALRTVEPALKRSRLVERRHDTLRHVRPAPQRGEVPRRPSVVVAWGISPSSDPSPYVCLRPCPAQRRRQRDRIFSARFQKIHGEARGGILHHRNCVRRGWHAPSSSRRRRSPSLASLPPSVAIERPPRPPPVRRGVRHSGATSVNENCGGAQIRSRNCRSATGTAYRRATYSRPFHVGSGGRRPVAWTTYSAWHAPSASSATAQRASAPAAHNLVLYSGPGCVYTRSGVMPISLSASKPDWSIPRRRWRLPQGWCAFHARLGRSTFFDVQKFCLNRWYFVFHILPSRSPSLLSDQYARHRQNSCFWRTCLCAAFVEILGYQWVCFDTQNFVRRSRRYHYRFRRLGGPTTAT